MEQAQMAGNVLHVANIGLKYFPPRRIGAQINLAVVRSQENDGTSNRLRLIANKHIGPQCVVEVRPRPLRHLVVVA